MVLRVSESFGRSLLAETIGRNEGSSDDGTQRRMTEVDAVVQRQNDAPMFVKVVVAGVSGRPVMGHSGEGRLL